MKTNTPTLSKVRKNFQNVLLAIAAAISQSVFAAEATVDPHQIGSKYSPLKQINTSNVANLEKAWEYHTGDLPKNMTKKMLVAFEDHPNMIDGNLVICSVKRRIIALDPATGKERWSYDPQDPLDAENIGMRKCRGVSHWVDSQAAEGSACKSRIFMGTANYRLVSIDAKTGKPCEGFGDHGVVKMPVNKPLLFTGEVIATSNPAIVNDVVVVGSSVADNQRVNAPSGRVMAYNARTGAFMWEFDPVPRKADDPAMKSWKTGTDAFGAGNVWSTMSADNALDLVYLPTTSPSSDFYGGDRVGDNHYTTSVVALKGSTGEVVWHYQIVHHNVFDYDIPTEPVLIDYPQNGAMVPALIQNTKMGLIFVLNRATGEPLVPIEERPVSQQGKVDGEVLSPTQPFSVGMPTIGKRGFSPDEAWGFTPIDKWLCKREIEKLDFGSGFMPPSLRGSIQSPSSGGGPNWGGSAYDPNSHVMIVPSNRVPMVLTLIPREQVKPEELSGAAVEGMKMTFDVKGSKYIPQIHPLLSPLGAPCSTPPWATLTAIDIVNKKTLWEVPLGKIDKMSPMPMPSFVNSELGTPGAGGPLLTAGGLLFIGYTLDDRMRAFDAKTGKVLWTADLPAAGVGVPTTYEVNGEQYVVIPAGGHSMYGSTMGDSVVAYKLKH